jgi:hypothetical protein
VSLQQLAVGLALRLKLGLALAWDQRLESVLGLALASSQHLVLGLVMAQLASSACFLQAKLQPKSLPDRHTQQCCEQRLQSNT